MKRFWKTAEAVVEPTAAGACGSTGGRCGRPAARPLIVPTEAAGRGHRRRMERGRGNGRPARHAADRPRQCGDRPGRARPAGIRRRARPLRARATSLCYRAEGPETLVDAAGGKLGRAARLGAAALRRRFRDHHRHHACRPAAGDGRAAGPCGRGARSVPAGRPVAAGDDRRLAGRRRWRCWRERCRPKQAWEAVSLDERWQLEQWGDDAEAEAALDAPPARLPRRARGSSSCSSLVLRADQVADEAQQIGLALAA